MPQRIVILLVLAITSTVWAQDVNYTMASYSVTLAFVDPHVTNGRLPLPKEIPPPEYPSDMILAYIDGEVIVEFTVTAQGSVSSLKVEKSDGEDFQNSVLHTAKKWIFSPAVEDKTGRAMSVAMRCTVRFSIQELRPNQAAEPTRTTVTPPAGVGDRASGARGSP